MEILDQVLTVIARISLAIGMVAFGIGAGWFTLRAFRMEEGWQLKAVVYGVFFAFVGWLVRFTAPGALGGFLLGAAGAMIFWGMIRGVDQE